MSNIFNLDNPFFTAMSKLCDLVWLSILYVFLCIPIITIGPATTALYYAVVKVVRRERGYVTREFFHSFKNNLKQGMGLTAILVIAYLILYLDRKYALALMNQSETGQKWTILWCIFNAIGVILLCMTVYVFPILSRFTMTVKGVLKTSLLMSIRHLPSTILMVVIVGGSVLLCTFFIPLIILPGLGCLLTSFLMERIFKKYMPKSEGKPEETGKDEWYLE